MTNPNTKQPKGLDFREDTFRPYATALGELTLAWNDLHERLALLFWDGLGIANGVLPFSLWYSITLDRAQRDMLRAITQTVALGSPTPAHAKKEIEWILDETEKLENLRNNALHSPFIKSGESTIAPSDGLGHKRARQLVGKNLLKEFCWFYDTAITLRDYSVALHRVWSEMPPAWPDRPKLPNRGDSNERKRPRQG